MKHEMIWRFSHQKWMGKNKMGKAIMGTKPLRLELHGNVPFVHYYYYYKHNWSIIYFLMGRFILLRWERWIPSYDVKLLRVWYFCDFYNISAQTVFSTLEITTWTSPIPDLGNKGTPEQPLWFRLSICKLKTPATISRYVACSSFSDSGESAKNREMARRTASGKRRENGRRAGAFPSSCLSPLSERLEQATCYAVTIF